MLTPIACMVCNVDPATTSLLLPLAQATLISAPILMRSQLRRGFQAVRARRPGADRDVARETPADGPDLSAERLDR